MSVVLRLQEISTCSVVLGRSLAAVAMYVNRFGHLPLHNILVKTIILGLKRTRNTCQKYLEAWT